MLRVCVGRLLRSIREREQRTKNKDIKDNVDVLKNNNFKIKAADVAECFQQTTEEQQERKHNKRREKLLND